jgi:uncharacterized protein (DUF924 family)
MREKPAEREQRDLFLPARRNLQLVGLIAISALAGPLIVSTVQKGMSMQSPALAARIENSDSFAEALAVIDFWRDAGSTLWFTKDAGFDRRFRERFSTLHEQAARGELEAWVNNPFGSLALVILLDQYPRNAYRGTARMYATDEHARKIAAAALARRHDKVFEEPLRLFFRLPFAHSENPADQDRSVRMAEPLGGPNLERARHHRDIVRRFGRFPHRNPILGRGMTREEQEYLDGGGYKG